MSSVDERVVNMKFNNTQFQSGVASTMSTLDKLKKGLNLDGAKKGLDSLAKAGQNFTMGNFSSGLENVSSKFIALSTIGITALSNITTAALNAGATLVKSLTVDPIAQGLEEYETNLNAIQTILANTSTKGGNLETVNAALAQLNAYSDKTIYNFSEMARNIGTFTAAGVDLDTSVNAIKGIANLAAVSGSSSDQASTAMYQLSQALSTGTVKLMDWNSVVNAGMGGEVFQENLKETARVHGVAVDQIIDDEGSFRDSLQTGWLTSEILTESLSKMTGDLTDEQLASMGYTADQIVAIQKMAATASDAATKVKTFSQLVGTLQESVGSGWSQTFQLIFGDFDQAKDLWTGVNNTIGGIIQAQAKARNDLLAGFNKLGGRDVAIKAITNAFNALMAILKPIGEAFSDIFPPTTAQQLFDIVSAIEKFTASLMPSEKTLANIKRTAAGFFAVLDIGWMIIKQVVSTLAGLFGTVAEGGDGFLGVTANIGDFLVKVRDAIKNGDGLAKTFKFIGDMLQKPIDLLKKLGQITIDWVNVDSLAEAWDKVAGAIQAVYEFIKPAIDWTVNGLKQIGTAISTAFKEMDPSLLVGLLNVGLFAGITLAIKKIIKLVKGFFGGLLGGGGIGDSIKEIFGSVTETFSAMQAKLKAEALVKIAVAIGILVAAVVVLSFVDTAKLFISLGAIATMFTLLSGFMVVVDKFTTTKGAAKMGIIAGGFILLSTAMVIFASALLIMSSMDWNELSRGLVGMGVGLGILIGAAKLLTPALALKLSSMAVAMLGLSTAMILLASALKIMGGMSWEDSAKSLAVLGGALGILVGVMKGVEKGIVGAGAIVIIAFALNILGGALKIFATMSWDDIGRAMTVLAGSLVILAGAMFLMSSPTTLIGAASMPVIAFGLSILAGALKIFATMNWDDIGRAMTVLAASLVILAVGVTLMTPAIVGAAALVVIAGALAILAPVLILLGTMSWEAIGTGLGALAAVLGILALAGVLLIPALPGLLGLAAAIVLIGIGAMAAGIGISLFAGGLAILGTAAPLAAESISTAILTLVALIPQAMAAFAQGLIDFAIVIAEGGTEFTAAMVVLLQALIDATNQMAPQIVDTLNMLLGLMLASLINSIPKMVDAGYRILIGVLNGIAKNIGGVVTAATNVIVNFINGISNNLPRVIQAGINMIISFVNGLADGIRNNTDRMREAGNNLAWAIIDGMTGGISDGIGAVMDAAARLASAIPGPIKKLLGIASPSKVLRSFGQFVAQGLALGVEDDTGLVVKSAAQMGTAAVDAVSNSLSKMSLSLIDNIDSTPVIRPVLDLSSVARDAGLIPGILGKPSLSLEGTNANAKAAAAGYDDNQRVYTEADGTPTDTTGETIHFTQINNSPKALSAGEIYRQTKSQLGVLKGELDK